jgi:hypothetical protein
LNVYKIIKPIPIIKLNSYMVTIPFDICDIDIPYIHPLFAYHSCEKMFKTPAELCMEVVLPLEYINNIYCVGTYLVDAYILKMNENKTMNEFDPINSIIDIV